MGRYKRFIQDFIQILYEELIGLEVSLQGFYDYEGSSAAPSRQSIAGFNLEKEPKELPLVDKALIISFLV